MGLFNSQSTVLQLSMKVSYTRARFQSFKGPKRWFLHHNLCISVPSYSTHSHHMHLLCFLLLSHFLLLLIVPPKGLFPFFPPSLWGPRLSKHNTLSQSINQAIERHLLYCFVLFLFFFRCRLLLFIRSSPLISLIICVSPNARGSFIQLLCFGSIPTSHAPL